MELRALLSKIIDNLEKLRHKEGAKENLKAKKDSRKVDKKKDTKKIMLLCQ